MASSAIGLKSPIGLQDTRNVLINGEFNLWQRGITSSIGFIGGGGIQNQYCADRWRYYAQTSSTGNGSTAPDVQISRVNFGLAEPSGAVNSSKYYLNIFFGHTADLAGAPFTAPAAGEPNGVTGMFAAGTGEGNFLALVQDIEDVNTLAGKSAILSFWAKSDFTGQVIIPRLKQYFGKDASIGSDSVNYIGTTGARHTIDNTWRQYKTEFNLSGVNGKVLGTSGDHALQLSLFFHRCRGHGLGGGFAGTTMELGNGTGLTGNISIAQVQLEQGTNATEFDTRSDAAELLDCQRFFQKSYLLDDAPGTNTEVTANESHSGYVEGVPPSTSNHAWLTSFSSRMRMKTNNTPLAAKFPTIRIYDLGGNPDQMRASSGSSPRTVGYGSSYTNQEIEIYGVGPLKFKAATHYSSGGGQALYYEWTAEAEMNVETADS